MKPRFLNQKLGKRMSRKTHLQKAKVLAPQNRPRQAAKKGPPPRAPHGTAPADPAR